MSNGSRYLPVLSSCRLIIYLSCVPSDPALTQLQFTFSPLWTNQINAIRFRTVSVEYRFSSECFYVFNKSMLNVLQKISVVWSTWCGATVTTYSSLTNEYLGCHAFILKYQRFLLYQSITSKRAFYHTRILYPASTIVAKHPTTVSRGRSATSHASASLKNLTNPHRHLPYAR